MFCTHGDSMSGVKPSLVRQISLLEEADRALVFFPPLNIMNQRVPKIVSARLITAICCTRGFFRGCSISFQNCTIKIALYIKQWYVLMVSIVI